MKDLQGLSDTGMLWFMNRTVFLPRGYEMVLVSDKGGKVIGWDIVTTAPGAAFGDDPVMVHKVEALFRDLTHAVTSTS